MYSTSYSAYTHTTLPVSFPYTQKNDNLMTYGSGLEFSWRGFRFCAFLFLFDSIRPTWQGSNSTSFFFFLSLLYIYSILFVSLRIFGYIYFFCFFFVSDLLVLETPPGQSAERFSAPCELAVRPWPIRNEPDDGGLCVCVCNEQHQME